MAILTNITPEHLDYHKTMEDYAASKKKLFQNVVNNSKSNKMAILPKDDKIGRERADDIWYRLRSNTQGGKYHL